MFIMYNITETCALSAGYSTSKYGQSKLRNITLLKVKLCITSKDKSS